MKNYVLTAFNDKGKTLIDERFEAENDDEAKKFGEEKLAELNYQNHTSRVTKSSGALVLFHR
ncbi:YhzD family protein [Bacillaceae bacterium IKA-2]|nr:YhzD family protein [Bacillaceae bacterium IKA-2]